mmetsp:Transcript_9736/g.9471  ORF Transcript_9736/g.9471 Transcript_9736/m.9471 type:complete len:224 (-) Transcript_9736:1039-1710(-)
MVIVIESRDFTKSLLAEVSLLDLFFIQVLLSAQDLQQILLPDQVLLVEWRVRVIFLLRALLIDHRRLHKSCLSLFGAVIFLLFVQLNDFFGTPSFVLGFLHQDGRAPCPALNPLRVHRELFIPFHVKFGLLLKFIVLGRHANLNGVGIPLSVLDLLVLSKVYLESILLIAELFDVGSFLDEVLGHGFEGLDAPFVKMGQLFLQEALLEGQRELVFLPSFRLKH